MLFLFKGVSTTLEEEHGEELFAGSSYTLLPPLTLLVTMLTFKPKFVDGDFSFSGSNCWSFGGQRQSTAQSKGDGRKKKHKYTTI